MIEWLHQHQVTTVILGGLALDYCVKTTALQLKNVGFNVVVNLSATKGIADETVQQALQQMQRAGISLAANIEELKLQLNA